MPGKCYDHLATGKPILAIAPMDSEADPMVRGNGFGMCADTMDHSSLTQVLMQATQQTDQRECHIANNAEIATKCARLSLIGQNSGVIMDALAAKTARTNCSLNTVGLEL